MFFAFLELVFIIIAKLISNWISKPVEESFEKQKDFIADASHELKTPLSVITASAEALENNPKEKKWLNNIKSESERMNNLIIDLLDLAKTENGNLELSMGNLSKAVELTTLTFEGIGQSKIEEVFFGSINIPSEEIRCPRKSIKGTQNSHFSSLAYKPALRSRVSTSER